MRLSSGGIFNWQLTTISCLCLTQVVLFQGDAMNFAYLCLMASSVLGNGVYGQDSPATSFTCHGRPPGYYADLETGCETYHVCDGNNHFTYFCPKKTLFQQRSQICDHFYLVRCEDSPSFYEEEKLLYSEKIKKISSEEVENKTTEWIESTMEEMTEVSTTTFNHASTDITTTTMEETTTVETSTDSTARKSIRFRLKDFRSLFFIPELENSIVGKPREREFELPVAEMEQMRFRNRKEKSTSTTCSSHCDPKFFVPGSCHPCITIK